MVDFRNRIFRTVVAIRAKQTKCADITSLPWFLYYCLPFIGLLLNNLQFFWSKEGIFFNLLHEYLLWRG